MAKTQTQGENENGNFHTLKDRIDGAILDSRRIFLCNAVDSDTCNDIIRKLWYLDQRAPGKPILFVINSPGGSVDAGFAIWDQIKLISCPVITLVTGMAASMGSILSLAASPGKRYCTPNARIMIHQPHIGGVIQGQATDLEIQALQILKTRKQLVKLYVEATGKDEETVDRAIDRDMWMNPQEALEFGLLDKIVNSINDIA